ncbi:MAG: amino acid permease [Phycisphaerae bacterium]|nr:amino acid permease [Phycisphaerae bacterium]
MALKKELGPAGVFCIAAGAMISSGLFVLPGIAFAKAGPAMILAYLLAGVLVIPAMLSKAELATAMPKAGGSYFYIERSLGSLPGTMAGLANWFSLALKSAFALIGIGAFATLIRPETSDIEIKAIAIAFCVFFSVLNIVGVRHVGRIQVLLVGILLGTLGLYIVLAAPVMKHEHFADFMPHGFGSVLATAALVFVSFGGLTKVASVAEEIKNPGRNIPLGMFLAFVVVMIIYLLVTFVTTGVVEGGALSNSLVPISLGAKESMGLAGVFILGAGAMLAFITTANSGILSASRSPMAMGRDDLLPRFLGRVNRRFSTPHVSIIATSIFMMVVIAFLSIENLVKTASTMMILMFLLVNVSVIIMRVSKIQNYRPVFHCPLYPWIQIGAIVSYVFLIIEMGAVPLLITGGFGALAVGWYLLYGKVRVGRESAFIYLVRRITSRKLANGQTKGRALEQELKKIVLEREGIRGDRFDKLIQDCAILDIDESIRAKDMFARAARALADHIDIPENKLFELLLAREKESSTVIQPGLAIPHIVVEGQNIFAVLMIRSKAGIIFSELHQPVRTVFVLIGSRDQRNFHLRALMAIAHIVEEPDFEKRWMEAANPEQLRDVVLLSGRTREAV